MKVDRLSRFSLSMPANLVRQFDAMAQEKGFANRSQAVAELVRSALVEHHAQVGLHDIAGTVTLVYDHHKRNIQGLLTDIQHEHGNWIISTLHVHLDHHHCMEVMAVRGPAAQVKAMADQLITAKGVKHGKLTVTTTGEELDKHEH
jgi:CopG family nickel-responsive transcriptional regulator